MSRVRWCGYKRDRPWVPFQALGHYDYGAGRAPVAATFLVSRALTVCPSPALKRASAVAGAEPCALSGGVGWGHAGAQGEGHGSSWAPDLISARPWVCGPEPS